MCRRTALQTQAVGGLGELGAPMLGERHAIEVVHAAYDSSASNGAWTSALCAAFAQALGPGAAAHVLDARELRERARPDRELGAAVDALELIAGAAPRLVTSSQRAVVASFWTAVRPPGTAPASPLQLLVLVANDGGGDGPIVIGVTERRCKVSSQVRARWSAVARHVSIASRLRHALDALGHGEESSLSDVRPAPSTQDRLRAAARAAGTPGLAGLGCARVDAWDKLALAQWSLVDSFVAGDQLFIVAHESAAPELDPRRLSPRERRVAELTALGWAGKRIAYEMHLSPAAVSEALRSATHKVGLHQPLELVCLIRALRAPAAEQAP